MRAFLASLLPAVLLGAGPAQDLSGAHYSPLAEITPQNISRLSRAWTYHTHEKGRQFETTPLLAGGLLFFTSQSSRVIALEPETGREIWAFDPHLSHPAKRRLRRRRRAEEYRQRTKDRSANRLHTLTARVHVNLDPVHGCPGVAGTRVLQWASGFAPCGLHHSLGALRYASRYAPGLHPNRALNARPKCVMSENPHAIASSSSVRLVSAGSSSARRLACSRYS